VSTMSPERGAGWAATSGPRSLAIVVRLFSKRASMDGVRVQGLRRECLRADRLGVARGDDREPHPGPVTPRRQWR
jgi:hypothetical protein